MKRPALALFAAVGATLLLAAGQGTTAQRQLRVGYVIGAGDTPSQATLFGLPYAGFINGVKAHKLDGRVLQAAPNQDPTGPLRIFGRQQYDLVIMGIADPEALATVAAEYPETKFMLPDFPTEAYGARLKNVQGTDFRAGEAGYLAGYLAALMEKRRPGRDVVGVVAGQRFPGVDRWIVGYRAGAKNADRGIRVLTTYTDSFTNPSKCKTVALAQIAQGAGAILNVAGGCGYGTLEAAKEKGIWGIGVDVDQSFLGSHILTSAVIRLDVAVENALDTISKGTFKAGRDEVFDLRNGGVKLGRISPKVPASVRRQVDQIRRQIIAGKITVPALT